MAQPAQKAGEHQLELIGLQLSKPPDCPDVWIGRDILDQERSGSEEADVDSDLVLGAAEAGRMRNDRDQCPVRVSVSDADY